MNEEGTLPWIKRNLIGIALLTVFLVPVGFLVILISRLILLGPKKAFIKMPSIKQSFIVGLAVLWVPIVLPDPEEGRMGAYSESNPAGYDYKIEGKKVIFNKPPKERKNNQLFVTCYDGKRYYVKPETNGRTKIFTIQGPDTKFDEDSPAEGVGVKCVVRRLQRNYAISKKKFESDPLKYAWSNHNWDERVPDGYNAGHHKRGYWTFWTILMLSLGALTLLGAVVDTTPSQHSHHNQDEPNTNQ